MVKILCLFVIFTIVKYGKFVLKMSFLLVIYSLVITSWLVKCFMCVIDPLKCNLLRLVNSFCLCADFHYCRIWIQQFCPRCLFCVESYSWLIENSQMCTWNSSQFLSPELFYGYVMFIGNSQKGARYLSSLVYRWCVWSIQNWLQFEQHYSDTVSLHVFLW